MLLTVLSWMSWPFEKRRLWLTAPFLLGALALAAGGYLMIPFLSGYDRLQSIRISSTMSCYANVDVYVTAQESGKFLLAVVPRVSGDSVPEVETEQIDAFRRWAHRDRQASPPRQIVQYDPGCQSARFTLETRNNVQIRLVGYFVGSENQSHTFELEGDENARKLGFQRYRPSQNSGVRASTGPNFDGNDGIYWDYQISVPNLIVNMPGYQFAPQGATLEDILAIPAREQATGVSATLFEVRCSQCRGRGPLGNRLALAISHGRDELERELGTGPDVERDSRIVAISGYPWQVSLLGFLHGDRRQLGDDWISRGVPRAEAAAIDHGSHRVDGFGWERRDWLDREQAVTIFASLLLGLGTTLWVELLIVWLHSISSPRREDAAARPALPSHRMRYRRSNPSAKDPKGGSR